MNSCFATPLLRFAGAKHSAENAYLNNSFIRFILLLNSLLISVFKKSLKITVVLLLIVAIVLVFHPLVKSYSYPEKNFAYFSLQQN